MTPEEKIRTHFRMQTAVEGSREVLDAIIHDDIVVNDPPAGVRTEGKEAIWPSYATPVEDKSGPHTFSYRAEFIEYVGGEDQGYAKWTFVPTGNFAVLWGLTSVQLAEADSIEITIVANIKFKDGKIILIDEYWNPTPLLQRFGIEIPTPSTAHLAG